MDEFQEFARQQRLGKQVALAKAQSTAMSKSRYTVFLTLFAITFVPSSWAIQMIALHRVRFLEP
jgi:hypothetical protein